jgi:hypothetical protein
MDILGRSRQTARIALGALLVISALTTLSACGSSKDKGSSDLKVTETQPGPNTYAYEGVKPVKGGTVKIAFTNKGKVEHEIQLVQVDGTHSQAEVLAALKKVVAGQGQPLAAYLHPAGGVTAVKPGQTGTASVVLAPGKYYAVDTDSGQADNSPPYFTQGAVQALEVTGDKSTGSLPSAQQTVTIKDVPGDKFEFVPPSGLKTGKTTLELDNQSKKEFHQVTFAPIAPGKTLADVKKALASNGPPKGPPPVDFNAAVGTSVIEKQSKLVADLNFTKPGNYVMLCFVGDRDGKGPPHFLKGLLKEVKVS